jgi:DNA-binding transcriptional LysR family regulator
MPSRQSTFRGFVRHSYLEACLAGLGIGQLFDLGTEMFLADGRLINLFPTWVDERFPLYG